MDTLDWDATPIIRSESYSWKNQQQQMIKDSLMMSNSYLLTPVSSKVNALINPIQQQCQDIGDLNALSAMILQEFGAAFDPIHVLSSWNIPQRQEAATRLAADSVAAKSGAGSSRDCTKMGPPHFSPPSNMLYFGNDQLAACGQMADDLGSNNRLLSKNRSLDCLLSANNTSNYTDTSVEDDGISMIFSDDSKSLWNTNNDNFADSSGESAIDAFNSKPIDVNDSNNIECPVNETDQHNNPIRSSEVKRHMTKRRYNRALLQRDSSTRDSGFQLISEIQPKSKKPRSENKLPNSANQQSSSSASSADDEPDLEAIAQMKEMIYCAAAFRPVSFGTEAEAKKPKRKNVRISTDPQTVAARQRREKISEKIKILQKMVPGGSKMDTASMLDEAANYLKFLRSRIKAMEAFGHKIDPLIMTNISSLSSIPFNYPFSMQPHIPLQLDNPVQRPYS